MLDSKDASADDYRRFIKHIVYIAGRAKSDRFTNAVHAQYDLAIRKPALDVGFKALTASSPELSLNITPWNCLSPRVT